MKMKQLYVADRKHWRQWLSEHYATEAGIWFIFYKKETFKPTVDYEDAVEEALCFGWIDSIIKKVDEEKYVRKFTPRKDQSIWSQLNKKRIDKMIQQGRMTEAGLAKVKAAKKSGVWDQETRSRLPIEMPPELVKALARNKKAKKNFDQLAPTYRRHYIGWVATAKRPETRERRIAESIALLEKGEKLGMK